MRVLNLTGMHLRSLWNWRSVYLGRLIEPLAYLAFMVVGLNASVAQVSYHGHALGYGEYVVPGILALLGVRAGTAAVSDVSNDRKWGVYAFARLADISPGGYFVSLVLAALPLAYVQALSIVLLALLLLPGVGVSVLAVSALLALPLFLTCWIGVGALMGALIHSYSQRDLILSLVNLPIILTAPIFFSIDSAPIFLQVMAMLNPLTYQANLLRDLTLHIPWQFNGVVALALALMFAALSVTALARSEWLTAER